MIDDALLRPGRLEIHMEISLPNEEGRIEILNIHTATMKASKRSVGHTLNSKSACFFLPDEGPLTRLGEDVSIPELAEMTKNFSGADIEGLVRAAQSYSLNSFVDHNKKVRLEVRPSPPDLPCSTLPASGQVK